jgi:hypothetical protein
MVSGRIRSGELTRVIQELTRTTTPLVGTVINRIDAKGDDYSSHYYSYYGTGSDRAEGDGPTPGSGAGLDGQHPSVDHPVRQFGNPGD